MPFGAARLQFTRRFRQLRKIFNILKIALPFFR